MEKNGARRLWHVVRVAFFMLRRNISKRKLLLDLKYLTLKRSKLAGKPPAGKLTHHHNHHPSSGGMYQNDTVERDPHAHEYTCTESEMDAVNRVLEMMASKNDDVEASPYPYYMYSPGFGFGRSPAVRQLRVTDSPYPLYGGDDPNSNRVDEAAEEFIKRFYAQLNQQMVACA